MSRGSYDLSVTRSINVLFKNCRQTNDINDETSPIEAGLSWITKFNNNFNYSKELQLQQENGVQRKRVGFEMLDRGIARNGYAILNKNDEEIGFVTSGTGI